MYDVISTLYAEEIRIRKLAGNLIEVHAPTRLWLAGDMIFIRSWDREVFTGTVIVNESTDPVNETDVLLVEV